MTFEAGIDPHRLPFAGVTITTAIGIRFMQDIPHQCRPVAAMRVVTGTAVFQFIREIRMFLIYS